MQSIDFTFPSPVENLQFDDVLLHLAEKELCEETLRFWEYPEPFIVLGRIGKLGEDVNLEQTREANIPVYRRSSGGGTVVQGSGCLNYTLILSKQKSSGLNDIRKSYAIILQKVIRALASLSIDAEFFPTSDLALKKNKKKFSGNAQRRGRNCILHHGTILYGFNLSLISRYLKMPRDIPEYRKARSHQEFVTNISAGSKELKRAMRIEFSARALRTLLNNAEKEAMRAARNSVQLNRYSIQV